MLMHECKHICYNRLTLEDFAKLVNIYLGLINIFSHKLVYFLNQICHQSYGRALVAFP